MINAIEHIHFQITRSCNLRCAFCGQWGKTGFFRDAAGEEMTLPDWEKVIGELENSNKPLPKITVWGGEPLVSPVFDGIVSMLKNKGFVAEIVTNGVLLDKHRDIVKACVDKVFVSIDGTREVHDSVRGAGVYDTVMKNIAELGHKNVTVMSVITEKLVKVLPEFLKELDKLNIRELILQDMIGLKSEEIDRYKKWLMSDFGIKAEYIDSWENNGKIDFSKELDSVPIPEGLGFSVVHKRHTSEGVCKSAFSHPHIAWNGNVHYCTDFYDFSAGNVKENSLEEIFENEKSEKFRQAVQNNRCPACNACSWRNGNQIEN